MHRVQAVLFDLDDTLLNRAETFSRFCDHLIDLLFHKEHDGIQRQEVKAFMLHADQNGYESRSIFYQKLIDRWNLSIPVEDLEDEWYRVFDQFAVPAKDLTRVLEVLSKKYQLGIITNGSSSMQNRKIDALGIRHNFQVITISGEVGIRKPDPEIFGSTCAALGVFPSSAVYVGDHFQKDIMGAMNAGLDAIWLDHHMENESFPQRIDRLSSILDLL